MRGLADISFSLELLRDSQQTMISEPNCQVDSFDLEFRLFVERGDSLEKQELVYIPRVSHDTHPFESAAQHQHPSPVTRRELVKVSRAVGEDDISEVLEREPLFLVNLAKVQGL